MTERKYSSVAVPTTLGSGIADDATSITVAAANGFPGSTPYTLVIDPDTADEELVSVTAVGGLTLTVTRGFDSTTAKSHSAGAVVRHFWSAADLREPQQHIEGSSGVHGVSGSVVGTTDEQSMSNKTLVSPTITTPVLTLKQSASPTPTTEGEVQWDTDDDTLVVGVGSGTKVFSDDSVSSGIHGVTGTLVGTSDTQVLTGKTIDGDDNTIQDVGYAAVKQSAWTAYTPAWTATSSNPSGAASLTGKYCRIGNTVLFRVTLEMDGGTSFGSGTWLISLPVTAVAGITGGFPVASAFLLDSSPYAAYIGQAQLTSTSTARLVYQKVTGEQGVVTPTTPFTWATGDTIVLSGSYEAA